MSQLYNALHDAHIRKYGENGDKETPASLELDNGPQGMSLEREMLELQYNIELALPNLKKKIIQFIGSRPGEGASTIAQEFAKCCAKHTKQSVLLLQAQGAGKHSIWTNKNLPIVDLDVAIQTGQPLEEAIIPLGPSRLFISRFTGNLETQGGLMDTIETTDMWHMVRQRFDLVLIDTRPISASAEGLRLCSKADGVMLVLEAENTRSHVVHSAKNQILRAGGNLLGLVFNKQRHRIPAWTYDRL